MIEPIKIDNKKPIIAIAIGDPHGIGSELVLRSLTNKEIYQKTIPVVIGDMELLKRTQEFLETNFEFNKISEVEEAKGEFGKIDILDMSNIKWDEFRWGQVSKMSGNASLDYIETSMKLAMKGDIDAFIYGPLNKENMKRAGLRHASEAEYMQEFIGSNHIIILMIGKKSIITRVTTHVPLKDVSNYITQENVLKVIEMTDAILKRMGFGRPRIGIGALNPHMGEGGLCGREEIDVIIPAIEKAKKLDIEIAGIYPADTLYLGFDPNFCNRKIDVAIYMYHDIAGVSSKMLESGFEGGMFTMTAGLPVPVLTVGHGTAYPIAGKGEAKETSMINAIQFATRILGRFKNESRYP